MEAENRPLPRGKQSSRRGTPFVVRDVVISVAAKAATMSEYRGKTYYFCCPHCKARFDKDPDRYIQ